jgi:hypothetical protein
LVQVLLTPYLLLGPVWYAHRVMGDARHLALQEIADRIRSQLMADGMGPTRPSAFRELEARYRLTEEGYHTWPFRRGAFGGVGITAVLTIFGNVAAILYRLLSGS